MKVKGNKIIKSLTNRGLACGRAGSSGRCALKTEREEIIMQKNLSKVRNSRLNFSLNNHNKEDCEKF